ncbi:MAG: hypothetical protein H2038_05540 [Brevundimonas sp.]|uniref:hypothetical protein n=1 Tax=Brevundimonas sp. TaxID=1871086 RepID=UPI0018131172|nr:hypothetical protein [Brevundimonas sp.]MBA4804096.1 hypothetical protein [Brevundimonas sp.]
MFETIYSQLVLAAAVAVVTFAFAKGDEPERIGAAAYAMVFLATTMIKGSSSLSLPRWGVMGVETVLLVVFIGLAWHSRRPWPVWAASFQALVVTGYVLVAASLRPPHNAVAAVINMSNYALLIALAVGTFWAWQERRAVRLAEPPGPRHL